MLPPKRPYKRASIPRNPSSMSYVQVAPGGRYFMTEDRAPLLIIGHNDAMPWLNLSDLRGEKDINKVEEHIKMLVAYGVTVVRIMLEYAQHNTWYFENPISRPVPAMVLYWDNLIGLCERHGLRLLMIFWDTFFMARRWRNHPYSRNVPGLEKPEDFCTNPQAIETKQARIQFFIERWGNSPAIFAYDLFNEIHPHWGGTPEQQSDWISQMAHFVKDQELSRWGMAPAYSLDLRHATGGWLAGSPTEPPGS